MEIQNKPEVTVGIVTYNSSKTVIETLESIKAQTYDKLHLIVSDDCSTDNTIDICNQWIEKNADRFISTRVLTVSENTGVAGNSNRVWDACQTEYYKGIAGDDCLIPDCVETYVAYMESHPSTVVVFGKVICFGKRRYIKRYQSQFDYSFFDLSAQEQHSRLVNSSNCIPAGSTFIRIRRIRELNIRFDERIPLLEDWPMWIMLTGKGVKLEFLDKYTVRYRIGGNGLSSSGGAHSVKYYKSMLGFDLYYLFENEYNKDGDSAIESFIERQAAYYQYMIRMMTKTSEYRLGKFLLAPWRYIEKLLKIK